MKLQRIYPIFLYSCSQEKHSIEFNIFEIIMHLSKLAQSLELWERVSLVSNYAVFFCTSLSVFEETQSCFLTLSLIYSLYCSPRILTLSYYSHCSIFFSFLVFEPIISKVLKLLEKKKRQLLYMFKNLYETLKF